jgi:hypothetical protein
MSVDDLPMISPSDDDAEAPKEVRVNAPEPRRPGTAPVPKAAPAPAKPDPRNGSDARKPAAPAAANSATRPVAPVVKAPIPAAIPVGEDEDPEKLLREYAERQKTKVVRLEQQLMEYKKVVAERDGLRAKVDAMTKELQDAKRQVEASAKTEDMVKDLQGKVDAAVLSNSILAEDKEKLKKGLSQQTEFFAKAQERAEQAEKALAEAQDELVKQTQGREEAEAKVAGALKALQSTEGTPPVAKPAPAPKAISEAVTRPMKPVAPAAEEKPKDEKSASAPPAAKPGPGPQQRPPGRFSFLKK